MGSPGQMKYANLQVLKYIQITGLAQQLGTIRPIGLMAAKFAAGNQVCREVSVPDLRVRIPCQRRALRGEKSSASQSR